MESAYDITTNHQQTDKKCYKFDLKALGERPRATNINVHMPDKERRNKLHVFGNYSHIFVSWPSIKWSFKPVVLVHSLQFCSQNSGQQIEQFSINRQVNVSTKLLNIAICMERIHLYRIYSVERKLCLPWESNSQILYRLLTDYWGHKKTLFTVSCTSSLQKKKPLLINTSK